MIAVLPWLATAEAAIGSSDVELRAESRYAVEIKNTLTFPVLVRITRPDGSESWAGVVAGGRRQRIDGALARPGFRVTYAVPDTLREEFTAEVAATLGAVSMELAEVSEARRQFLASAGARTEARADARSAMRDERLAAAAVAAAAASKAYELEKAAAYRNASYIDASNTPYTCIRSEYGASDQFRSDHPGYQDFGSRGWCKEISYGDIPFMATLAAALEAARAESSYQEGREADNTAEARASRAFGDRLSGLAKQRANAIEADAAMNSFRADHGGEPVRLDGPVRGWRGGVTPWVMVTGGATALESDWSPDWMNGEEDLVVSTEANAWLAASPEWRISGPVDPLERHMATLMRLYVHLGLGLDTKALNAANAHALDGEAVGEPLGFSYSEARGGATLRLMGPSSFLDGTAGLRMGLSSALVSNPESPLTRGVVVPDFARDTGGPLSRWYAAVGGGVCVPLESPRTSGWSRPPSRVVASARFSAENFPVWEAGSDRLTDADGGTVALPDGLHVRAVVGVGMAF